MIEVLSYERAEKNKLIGYVDVKIPKAGLLIRRIAHFKNGEREWFSFPAYSIPKAEGGYNFIPYIQYESEVHKNEFFKQLSIKVKEHLSSKKPTVFDDDIPF